MARQKIGTVKTPTGSEYYCFWDTENCEVFVGTEPAGKAASKEEAWRKANYYATTLKKMK